MYLPVANAKPSWIELYNYGQGRVDLSGWCVVDKSGNTFVIPKGLGLAPPGGVVLMRFCPRPPHEADDRDFGNDGVVVLHYWGRRACAAFTGTANECALYSSRQQQDEQLVDYVCWGINYWWKNPEAPTKRHRAAVKAGIWSQGSAAYVGNNPMPGDSPRMRAGGSLARVHFSSKWPRPDWFICTPKDVTPARKNRWPAPHTAAPWFWWHAPAQGPLRFTWRGTKGPGYTTRIQIAKSAKFRRLLVDQLTEGNFTYDPKPGTYYWRVRYESKTDATNWSEPSRLIIDPPDP